MKKYLLLIFAALLLCGANVSAQTDSRNRTAETIVLDGLAQLPTESPKTFNAVINELASTGEKGILQIASKLVPPAQGKNAVFEYAISGISDFVTTKAGEKYRESVRKGLATAMDQAKDPDNKAYLMTQLAKCAVVADMPVFEKYLKDEKMSRYAIAAISSIPGNEADLVRIVKGGDLPRIELAKIVSFRKLQEVEDVVLGWTNESDVKTLKVVYNTLATIGTSKSIKVLAEAAKKAQYLPEPTSAVNAYIKLLENLDNNPKAQKKGGKELMSSSNPAYRCSGLYLSIKGSDKNAVKTIINALKDKDIQYRNTALQWAYPYCGGSVFSQVAANFEKLSVPAKIDVMRWFGNNHVAEAEQIVVESFDASDKVLAQEAMYAASKIGGDKMLVELMKQISGPNANVATEALLSFNGKINDEVVKVLKESKDENVIVPAIALAGKRHVHEAYPLVAKLTESSNATVSYAALNAMSGVVSSNDYEDACKRLDNSNGDVTVKLQRTVAAALAAENADSQFEKFNANMQKSSHPEYYYPLLAQAGTEKALAAIAKGMESNNTKKAACAAMLQVNNPVAIPVLIGMARTAGNDVKESVIAHYLTLVNKTNVNAVRKYQLLVDALELNPSEAQVKKILTELGNTRILQALVVANKYLDDKACSRAAAEALRNILSHNEGLNAGDDVRAALEKAKAVFVRDQKAGDHDAGYAIDDVAGLLTKTAKAGFSLKSSVKEFKSADKATACKCNKKFENFKMTFDWKATGKATIVLRDVPVININNNVVSFPASKDVKEGNANGEWNTLELEVIDERILVRLNGETVIENTIMHNIAGAQVPFEGGVKILSEDGSINVRNSNMNVLPSTPVFKLSPEEKKAGFEVLFDGRSLEKWHGNKVNYVTQNGAIYVSAQYGGWGNLYTNKKYSDFVYRFEFCFAGPGVNNGIGVRTPENVDAAYEGMEIQVLDHEDPIYADLNPYQQHGSVYGIIIPKRVKFGETGTWHKEEIRFVGDHVTVTVDGDVILDGNIREACKGHNVAPDGSNHNPYTLDHKNHPGLFNKEGFISFCGHGPGVKFRNVRILDLSKNKKRR